MLFFFVLKGMQLQSDWSDLAGTRKSSEILCLARLPASLTKIKKKMNELAYKSMDIF